MALQDEIRIRAAAKLLLANAKVIFGRGDVVGDPTLFTQEQIEQYAFVPSDAEVKCQYCKGSKTTWVELSLGTAASKKWRTTTSLPGKDDFQSCPSDKCVAHFKLENDTRSELKKSAAADAKLAQQAIKLGKKIVSINRALATAKSRLEDKDEARLCFCNKSGCDSNNMISCDGMGVKGCKWFGCPTPYKKMCCLARGWMCETAFEKREKENYLELANDEKAVFICYSCKATKKQLDQLDSIS